MTNKSNYEYLLSDLTKLNGVGIKTTNLLKKKKINNIFDLLWKLPKSFTDRSHSTKIKDLKIGENQTITIFPKKYSFPRVRNLPNKVLCSDETGEIDCIFFNSYEGYVRKILPLGKEITVSGKIGTGTEELAFEHPHGVSATALPPTPSGNLQRNITDQHGDTHGQTTAIANHENRSAKDQEPCFKTTQTPRFAL